MYYYAMPVLCQGACEIQDAHKGLCCFAVSRRGCQIIGKAPAET